MDCDYKCVYLGKNGICKQDGGQCLKEDCPEWMDCNSCKRSDKCEI